ncbi:MAG: hypothetical protein KGP12_02080 [Actinomycetales bacterium]|nr:hypothetical protein [Actinomycetales bacterium]
MSHGRRARWLHPGAWWAWALGLAAAASQTTNPLLLALIIAVAATVVVSRRPQAPWARSFGFFLRLGLLIIAIRLIVQVAFSASVGTTVILDLPGVALPDWMAGVRIGGQVTIESLLIALYDGLRLAAILAAFGAANSLASPARLLKSVPAALYEVGVSVVLAMTFTPALVTDLGRVQQARYLRGRASTGPRAVAGAAMPVLEGALERSVALAAAMDARGYGRRGTASPRRARTAAGLLLAGLVACAIGTYGLVSADAPGVLGLPMVGFGVTAAIASLAWSGRTTARTRYRPDPWGRPEWGVLGCGIAVAFAFAAAARISPDSMHTAVDPPAWPALGLLPSIGLLLALGPGLLAPPIPGSATAVPRIGRR